MAARCGAEGVSRSTRTMPARVDGKGAALGGAFLDALLACGLPDALSAASTSRLYQRAGVIFAKQVRIVVRQGSYQFHMDVVDHVGRLAEKFLPKDCARAIDG